MQVVLGAAASFIIGMALIPLVRTAALRTGFVDRPSQRKVHAVPVPLLGGLALYTAITAIMLAASGPTPLTLSIAVGGGMLVAVGLVDDYWKTRSRDFPVWPRLILYAAAGVVPLMYGIRIEGISRLGGQGMLLFTGWVSALVTVLWIFALINMINFIDGVDGLAGGVSIISAITLLVAALYKGHMETAVLAAVVAGTCSAFLAFNFHPARIFMGDAGAAFLGYALAVLAVNGAFKSATLVSVLVPVLALGVPILDTAVVMLRRLIRGTGLHRADKLHTHHALMRWGLNQVQTVAFLYLIAAVLGLLAIILLLVMG